MCPIVSWMTGFRINNLPRFLSEDTNEKTHAIIADDPLNPNEPLIIPLVLKVFTSYLPCRNPRASDYEDESIPHIDMTSKAQVWEPSEISFSEKEYAMTNFRGELIRSVIIARGQSIINCLSAGEDDAVDFMDDYNFFNTIDAKVDVAMFRASKGRCGVTSDSLSQKWFILSKEARRTV